MATIKIRSSELIDRGVIKPVPTGSSYINVGSTERIASAAAGLALMYFGLRKFSVPGLLLGAAGAVLFERGASGYCPVTNLAQKDSEKKPVDSAEITKSLTINKPRAEVYQYWRKLENLPTFMQHLESVHQTDPKRSHWVAPVPGGVGKISWDAEIIEEVENEKLSWRSVPNAAVDNAGEVLFKDAPGDQGTEIYVIIKYLPPAGAIGTAVAKIFKPAFKQMVKEDLRRFKRLMETGEIPVSEAQPSGKKLAFGDTTHDKIEKEYESLCYNNVKDLRVENVPDPEIISPKDMIVRVTLSSVCGSDLHIINGFIPTVKAGDVLGHEFMGEVVEIGRDVKKFVKGDRVVVASVIACGECHYCNQQSYSLCDNTNPNAYLPEKLFGDTLAGIYGYTHAFGGYAGSHAQYIRVPFADNGAFKVPEGLQDDSVIFCSDAFPTGYMAADMANIKPGSVVAVWGAGGVGQMAMQSAWLMGAERVIAIDREAYRLNVAKEKSKAETLNFAEVDILEALKDLTGGRGPDCCIDAVGMESSGTGIGYAYDKAKQWARIENDRPLVLRDAIMACRKGGTVSIVGVYSGFVDKIPMGAAMNKALTFRMGQMHGPKYIPRLLEHVQNGEVDPSFLVTHKMGLQQGQKGYDMFTQKQDNCMRVVFDPQQSN